MTGLLAILILVLTALGLPVFLGLGSGALLVPFLY